MNVTDLIAPYWGLIIGLAFVAAVFALNLLVYRHRWQSYPTMAHYLAQHPDCNKAGGVTCNRCGQKAAALRVGSRGHIYRCTWCDVDLYRIDASARDQG